MCGIVGVWTRRGRPVSPQLLAAATSRIRHRGPDDVGYLGWTPRTPATVGRDVAVAAGATVAFGHRRLSILDLSDCAWQPMLSSDGRFALLYNGEIYNYVELRSELERSGASFNSTGDTEVLLTALATWGTHALQRLTGMFAFALLDTVRETLLLVRDPFGIKPLYYTAGADRFAFASEAKALLALPGVGRVVNPSRLYDYLRLGRADDGGSTMFAAVQQLPAGHFMEIDLRSDAPVPPPREYWTPAARNRSELTLDAAAEALRERFLQNVRLHLRSDVPVGAALSGGLDSSAIVCAMRHLEPDAEIHTFTYIAAPPAVNERHWAVLVGEHAGTTQHFVSPTADELAQDVDAVIVAQDEPFGSTSIYAQHRVFQLAREAGIKVMLDGQGADELLAGYSYFLGGRLATLVRQGNVIAAARLLAALRGRSDIASLRAVLLEAGGRAAPGWLRDPLRRVGRAGAAPEWINSWWFASRGVTGAERPAYGGRGVVREQLLESLAVGLPSLLRYEDRNSMAHSIESRVPFLTAPLAEFLLSLPEEHLIDGQGMAKRVFRRAMRGIVPDAVLERRDKIAFQTPERVWLNTLAPWVDGLLASDRARSIPAWHDAEVRATWGEFRRGSHPYDWRAWRWINVIRWAELFDVEFDQLAPSTATR